MSLLTAFTISFTNNLLHETGVRYYKIPVIDTKFKSKDARVAAILLFTAISILLVTVLKGEVIALPLSDIRVLFSLVGLVMLFLMLNVSASPKNWNVLDGRKSTRYASALILLLIFGPWIGPIILNAVTKFLTDLWNQIVAFFLEPDFCNRLWDYSSHRQQCGDHRIADAAYRDWAVREIYIR